MNLPAYLQEHPHKGPFQPAPRYSEVGGMLEVHFEDVPAYVKPVNPQVTLLLAFDDKRVVGVKVFDVLGLIGGGK